MEFGLLGALYVHDGERERCVPAARQRTALATLLLHSGRVVGVQSLIDALWDDSPPATAMNTTRAYVMRLRRALGPAAADRIATRGSGYLLDLTDVVFDVHRFYALRDGGFAAAKATRWADASRQLGEALSLWRGDPLVDVPSSKLHREHGDQLAEARMQVLCGRIEADLHLGGKPGLVAELWTLVAAQPFREDLVGLLMQALYAEGRRAEALETFRQSRRRLADELGIEPGPELNGLHRRVLADDPALARVARAMSMDVAGSDTASGSLAETVQREDDLSRAEADFTLPTERASAPPRDAYRRAGLPPRAQLPPASVPNQLPARIGYFTGRDDALAALNAVLDVDPDTAEAPLVVIAGTAGVGKTALAVRWAAEIAERFPDGCLYVNLQGFESASAPPVAPEQAVRGFLQALGVSLDGIPPELAAQTALFRSLLTQRRVLLVLDNAYDAEQVRPLLPGAPGCLTVVTSRDRLAGLVALDGAHPVPLDLLSLEEAVSLLMRRLGPGYTGATPDTAADLAELCARLPLALNIAAARITTTPHLPLAALAEQLRAGDERLNALDAGTPAASTRAVFSWSHRQLSPAAARVFRLFGLSAGPDITAAALASLVGLSAPGLRPLLTELVAAHLLVEHSPGRFTCHDLLRVYAREQALVEADEQERSEATRRLVDHYLHSAYHAVQLASSHQQSIDLAPPAPGTTPEMAKAAEQALAWFIAEHQVLMYAVRTAADAGLAPQVWLLTWTFAPMLFQRALHQDALVALQLGLDVAERAGDAAARTRTHRLMAQSRTYLGQCDLAAPHATAALELAVDMGDPIAQAGAHRALAFILVRQENNREALKHTRQAHDLFEAAGFGPGLAFTISEIAYHLTQLGEHREALAYSKRSLALSMESDDRLLQAGALSNLGSAHSRLAEHKRAASCFSRAAEMFTDLAAHARAANALMALADAHDALGDHPTATTHRRQALDLCERSGHPNAEMVRARLAESSEAPSPA